MSNTYFFLMLIGTSCVFFLVYIGVGVKIHLINGRWANLRKKSKIAKEKEYVRKIHRCRCIKKIDTYLLAASLVVNLVYCMRASANWSADITDENPIKGIEEVYKDPKDRLAQNAEGKVVDIFMDGLFFSWFEEEEGRTKEGYKEKVDNLFDGMEPVSDILEKEPQGEEKDAYDACVDRQKEIDLAKVPNGATLEQVQQGKVEPEELGVRGSKEEYGLWKMRYLLYPIAANLQQWARTAVDVQTAMMKNPEYESDWAEIIEYSMNAVQLYLALMFYISAGESKADCCYWIAKVFYDLAQKMPDQYSGRVEHCYLMAYTFSEKGLTYKGVDYRSDDHISDLIKIRDKADKSLEAY